MDRFIEFSERPTTVVLVTLSAVVPPLVSYCYVAADRPPKKAVAAHAQPYRGELPAVPDGLTIEQATGRLPPGGSGRDGDENWCEVGAYGPVRGRDWRSHTYQGAAHRGGYAA